MPAFLAEERARSIPARVPKVFAETVAKQNAGIMEIVDSVLAAQVELSGVPRTRFDAALATSRPRSPSIRMARHGARADAKGDFRLGPAIYDRKMNSS